MSSDARYSVNHDLMSKDMRCGQPDLLIKMLLTEYWVDSTDSGKTAYFSQKESKNHEETEDNHPA